jgi:DNA polymerase phi
MQHPEIMSDHEWKLEQLKFLFSLGLCEVTNVGTELVRKY